MIVNCSVCGAEKKIVPAKYKIIMNKTGKFFCSRGHYWVWRRGDGRKHFCDVFRELAKTGNVAAAHAATLGKKTWNTGLTADTDERMKCARDNRIKYYEERDGLSRAGVDSIIKAKRGFYSFASKDKLPMCQKIVLELVESMTSECVAYEQFMLIGEDIPIFIDISIPLLKLAIEVDGKSHKMKSIIEKDKMRDCALISMGWKILRIDNEDVKNNLNSVIKTLRKYL